MMQTKYLKINPTSKNRLIGKKVGRRTKRVGEYQILKQEQNLQPSVSEKTLHHVAAFSFKNTCL